MPLRDILQKRDKLASSTTPEQPPQSTALQTPIPEIKFIRSDTTSQEIINPPTDDFNRGRPSASPSSEADSNSQSSPRKHRLSNVFRRSRSPSDSTTSQSHSQSSTPTRPRGERRLSHLLHLDHGVEGRARSNSRNSSRTSLNVPSDLPLIRDDDGGEDREAQWEKRATLLVQGNTNLNLGSGRGSCLDLNQEDGAGGYGSGNGRERSPSQSPGRVNAPEGDVDIQEAIRLHEAGELETSTKMFGRLADPNGADNALSQVLYGLALRHGWGCPPNPTKAINYLRLAATNSASVESTALQAGIQKGGAAKGELVLAIYELANCFRNGWGVEKDAVAARQYYETAANLGDADAMNEIAWCYLEGFGGKKDKFTAAKYYRLAEENGNKTLGNSWIWKEKYDPSK